MHERLSKASDESPFAQRLTAEQARGVRFVRPELVAEVEFAGWTADRHLRHAAFRGLREDKQPADIIREEAAADPPATIARSAVKLSHPDRVYWPGAGVIDTGQVTSESFR